MTTPRRSRALLRPALGVSALVLLSAPLGLVHLAGNAVETSRAGVTTVQVTLTPTLQPLGIDADGDLAARLSSEGAPLGGLPVNFLLPEGIDPAACQDVLTDTEGIATCDPGSLLAYAPAMSYGVAFRGSGALGAVSATDQVLIAGAPGETPPEDVTPPAEDAPPAQQPPSDQPPAQEPPAQEPPAPEPPAQEPEAPEPPVEDAPVDNAPADEPQPQPVTDLQA